MSISTYVADFEATVPPKSVDNIDLAKQQDLKVYCYGLRNINSDKTNNLYILYYTIYRYLSTVLLK